MSRINTFFASATWYDDDDSEPLGKSRHREPLRGRLCGTDQDHYAAEQLDHLTAKYTAQ